MRRLIPLLLAVLLLLGCNTAPDRDATAGTKTPEEPPVTLYDPNNIIEEMSDGAVRAYSLDGHSPTGLRFMGEQMLLFTNDDHVEMTTLLSLKGKDLAITGQVVLDSLIYPYETVISGDEKNLAYYNAEENSLVILNSDLVEIRREQLPDEVVERPVLSKDMNSLYYCVGNEIRVLDLQSGISRLLKQHTCQSQSITALHFGDRVLEVLLQEESGDNHVAFISAENGETLGTDVGLMTMSSQGDSYLICRLDGIVTEVLTGKRGQEIRSLSCEDGGRLVTAFEMNAVVTYNANALAVYDLTSGKVTSRLDLGKYVQIQTVTPEPGGSYLWLQAQDLQSNQRLLLRWDTAATEVREDEVYLTPYYTAESPDMEGLAVCQTQADAIGEKYGIRIHIGEDFAAPDGYTFIREHQVKALETALPKLDAALARLPADFLAGLGSVNKSGTIHLGLVRDIRDITDRTASDAGGLQYVMAGDHHLCLTVGSDLEESLYHQLSHVLDSYVYAGSKAFDLWDQLNPKGFAYFGTYNHEPVLEDDPNLQGDTRAFVDEHAMTFPREDRAALFAAAMKADNQALLAAPVLQNKLQQLCTGIREAYGWEKTELTLPWEQYLMKE